MQTDRRTLLGLGAALSVGSLGQSQEKSQRGKTRFAVNIEMWYGGTSFLERFDRARAMGFDAVEFWPWRGKDLDGIAAKCETLGLEIAQFTGWGFVPGMNNPKNHDEVEREITESCVVANRLGVRKITVVAGNDQPGMSQSEMHEHTITALKRVAPIAESAKVMLILEPMNIRRDHKGHSLCGSPDALRICRAVDSTHVKINWDFYHMQISEGDLCGRLREGFDQVGYVQVADHPGRNEPGTGEIHYNRVFKELWDLGYRDYVGLECSPRDGDDEAAVARVLAADVW